MWAITYEEHIWMRREGTIFIKECWIGRHVSHLGHFSWSVRVSWELNDLQILNPFCYILLPKVIDCWFITKSAFNVSNLLLVTSVWKYRTSLSILAYIHTMSTLICMKKALYFLALPNFGMSLLCCVCKIVRVLFYFKTLHARCRRKIHECHLIFK